MSDGRVALPPLTGWTVLRGAVVTAGILGFFGALLPMLVMHLHWHLGIPELYFAAPRTLGMMVMATSIGGFAGTAMTLSMIGRGTPVWFQSPRRLVVVGPYAHTRNPMVLSAIGIGAGLILYSGSILMLAYVLLGIVWWALVVRPRQAADLSRRFGREYEVWARNVPLIIPRISAYRILDDAPTRTLVGEGTSGALKSGRRRRR